MNKKGDILQKKYPESFIKATREYNTFEKNIPAPYIRKRFVSDVDTTARIIIAACGFYELYINGRRYTKGFLAPYISNTNDYIYCDEYEVPIEKGENILGLILGNGFQNNPGGYIWDFDKAPFRSAPMVAVLLTYNSSDGTAVVIESDTTFKVAESPIRSDDYRFGEVYDANFEIPGWNDKGFDDSGWNDAIEAESPGGELRLCLADSIVKETELRPVDIIKDGDSYIYDFGINNSGICRLNINNSIQGQKIELQHGELLKNGTLDIENIWFKNEFWERDKNIVHKDTYICCGKERETYMPLFTYHGFRYVRVSGITQEQATYDLLTFVVIHSDLQICGGFKCSNETVNKLQEFACRSAVSNFHYFPTDCPHREKNGWTGDASLSAEYVLINYKAEKSYREWQRNICKVQNEKGALSAIIPTGGWGYAFEGPAWDSVLIYLPYYVYVYRGETDMIKESAEAIEKYLKHLIDCMDEKGLISIGFGDWCPVGGIDDVAPRILTSSVIAMDIAEKAAFMFAVIGLERQKDFAADIAAKLKQSIRSHLIDFDTMTAYGNMQTCQAMCIFYNVFTPLEGEAAFQRLLMMIHDKEEHIDTGVLGERVIFHVLSRFGYSDLALWMIIRPDYPSCGNWVQRGATTLWEGFFPENEEQHSLNHHFRGDISAWFIKNIAGLQFNPNGNNIREVNIKPSFVKSIDNAEGYYDSPVGRITSSWKRQGENIRLCLEIPEETEATVLLPQDYVFEDKTNKKTLCSGEYNIRLGGK